MSERTISLINYFKFRIKWFCLFKEAFKIKTIILILLETTINILARRKYYLPAFQCISEPPRGRVSAELSKPVERKGAMCVVLV